MLRVLRRPNLRIKQIVFPHLFNFNSLSKGAGGVINYYMKIKIFKLLCFIVSCLLLSSCVTLLGKKQTIKVESYPAGAKVYAGNRFIGTTPCYHTSKKAKSTLTFEKDGYQSKTIETYTQMRGAIWWNWLFTGPIGLLVDIPYWDKYTSTYYKTNLSKLPQPKVYTPSKSSTIATELYASPYILNQIPLSNSNLELKPKIIYKKCKSAVFMIYTKDDEGIAQGSGFFITSSGIAVSNYHVFKGSLKGKEIIKLSTGKTYKIKEVLAYSEQYDYILFKVDGENFNYIPVTKRGYEVGDEVYAIGSPKGLENTLSNGLISQKHKDYYIQISVPIDHGSSGGALINSYGEVVGITSGGRDDSGANLNFARDIRAIFTTKY